MVSNGLNKTASDFNVSCRAIKSKALSFLTKENIHSFLQDDILLEVEDRYYLLLKLPESVNEDSAAAVFNKKKQRLTLTVGVL